MCWSQGKEEKDERKNRQVRLLSEKSSLERESNGYLLLRQWDDAKKGKETEGTGMDIRQGRTKAEHRGGAKYHVQKELEFQRAPVEELHVRILAVPD